MTVAELIATLDKLDPTHRVILSGYAGGYRDVKEWEQKEIILGIPKSLYGPHSSWNTDKDITEKVPAIHLT